MSAQKVLRRLFPSLGGEIPIATREEFMGRNSPVDAGTPGSLGEYSPDDYFGAGQSPFQDPWGKVLGIR